MVYRLRTQWCEQGARNVEPPAAVLDAQSTRGSPQGGDAGQCAQTALQCHDIRVQVVRHPANKNVGRWIRPGRPGLFAVKADSNGFVVLAK